MEKVGAIEITIKGSKGNFELSPDNYDIQEIMIMLQNAQDLLFPVNEKSRPLISYRLEEGSVKHIFKTYIQYIIGFNAILGQIAQSQNIDFLDSKTGKALEKIQSTAAKSNYSFQIKTSLNDSNEISVDRTTRFYRTEALWVDAELYLYGKLTNAGGKDKANIHLVTQEFGTVTIETPKIFLENVEENLLYKSYGIRANAKQNSETGEIDRASFKFIELLSYEPDYNESYLSQLRAKAKKNWLGQTDPDAWLREIRGYEA